MMVNYHEILHTEAPNLCKCRKIEANANSEDINMTQATDCADRGLYDSVQKIASSPHEQCD